MSNVPWKGIMTWYFINIFKAFTTFLSIKKSFLAFLYVVQDQLDLKLH